MGIIIHWADLAANWKGLGARLLVRDPAREGKGAVLRGKERNHESTIF